MRTTLTLDDDVARLIDDAVHRERRTMKQVVNDALRRGLAPKPDRKAFRVAPHDSAVRAGVDLLGLNRLVDELENDAIIQRARTTDS